MKALLLAASMVGACAAPMAHTETDIAVHWTVDAYPNLVELTGESLDTGRLEVYSAAPSLDSEHSPWIRLDDVSSVDDSLIGAVSLSNGRLIMNVSGPLQDGTDVYVRAYGRAIVNCYSGEPGAWELDATADHCGQYWETIK